MKGRNSPDTTVPILAKLKVLITTARWQAVVATAALFLTMWEASQAFKSAQTAKEEADKAERQLKAVEEVARQVRTLTASAERQATAAERSLAEARDLVSATRALRDEAARSVEVARDQLAQIKADSHALRRARVRFAGTEIERREVGFPLNLKAKFKNSGVEEPLKISVSTTASSAAPDSFVYRSGLGDCATMVPIPGVNWIDGDFYRKTLVVWSQEQERAYTSGKSHIYVYGRMCYTDSAESTHEVDFCVVFLANGKSHQCPIIDS